MKTPMAPDIRSLALIMKALSHEHRLELFLEIARQQEATFTTHHACVISEIRDRFKIGAPTLSHHLRELSLAGLIHTEKRGKHLVARINPEALQRVKDCLPMVQTSERKG